MGVWVMCLDLLCGIECVCVEDYDCGWCYYFCYFFFGMMSSEKYGDVIGLILLSGMMCWLVIVVCLMYCVCFVSLSLLSMCCILLKLWLSFIMMVVLVCVSCLCSLCLGSMFDSIDRFWL